MAVKNLRSIPETVFCPAINEEVKVKSIGHYPDTVMVILKSGKEVEVAIDDLKI